MTTLKTPPTAADWLAKIEESEAEHGELVELPSGFSALLAPPPIELWWGTEMMPQELTADVQRVFGETNGDPDEVESAFDEIGEERAGKVLIFMREIVRATCKRPRIVESNAQPDEMLASRLPLGDFAAIFAWGMASASNRTVKTKGGAVPATAIKGFRSKRQLPGARKNRRKVRAKAK